MVLKRRGGRIAGSGRTAEILKIPKVIGFTEKNDCIKITEANVTNSAKLI